MLKNRLRQSACRCYVFPAPAKSGVGIGVLQFFHSAQPRFMRFFCVRRTATPINGGLSEGIERCAGICGSRYANLAQFTTSEIGVSGGDFKNHSTEAAAMATIPTQAHPQFVWLFLAKYTATPDSLPVALRTQADTEAQAREQLSGWELTFAAKIRTQCSLHDIGEGFHTLNLCTQEMAEVCHD